MKKKNIVLGVTGSIAAYKACIIASQLMKEAYSVFVMMTREAREFISPLTFQYLTQNPVATDIFLEPREFNPAHTSLADKADLIVVAPATAHSIGKIAHGLCDDIVTCTIIASSAPVLFAPAMNEKMYYNTMVQENIEKLKSLGYKFIGPVKGRLACGYTGMGHIAEPCDIVQEAKNLLARKK
ncbi:MAG: flavoprotein [Candidatus Omnitrophota bacterium]